MEDNIDLELGLDTQPNAPTVVVRKNISLKLKNSSSKSRDSANATEASAKQYESKENIPGLNDVFHKHQKPKWDHKVNIIGEKVLDPLIHSCERCLLPILVYGRLMPCKHVFCHSCASKLDKMCPRCNSVVNRVERSELGSVFVCTYGGPRHGTSGCHRTYLSKRDLQAHIQYRHLNQRPPPPHLQGNNLPATAAGAGGAGGSMPLSSDSAPPQHVINPSQHIVMQQRGMMSQPHLMHPPPPQTNLPPPPIEYITPQHYAPGAPVYLNNPPMQHQQQQQQQPMMMQQHGQLISMQQQQQQHQQMSHIMMQQQQQQQPQNIMVMASRSANLITVPMQDEQLQQQQQPSQQQHYMLQQHMQQQQQQQQQKPQQYIIAHSQGGGHMLNRAPIINQQSNMAMMAPFQQANSAWPSNQNVPNAMTSQRPPSNQMHQYY